MTDQEQLTRHVENLIGDIVDEHARYFRREDWHAIFDTVLTGMFGDGTTDDDFDERS